MSNEGDNCAECKGSDTGCHVNLYSLIKLKDSTKKLLCLLEELQLKTHTKEPLPEESPNLSNILKPSLLSNSEEKIAPPLSVSEAIGAEAMKKLETHTKELDAIVIADEHDDCSVYKRLTRRCHCLNHKDYNDFIIHFNEETKFCTNSIGEIIKNMRILKKFLYMGGKYTKNALMFLNEGLNEAAFTEKVDIVQAIAYADLCGVFDEHTIVTTCISWLCKNETCAESMTKELTATLLYKIAQVEEGRRYLNFNSKVMRDLKKVLKKKSTKLDYDTIDCLNTVSSLLEPPPEQKLNLTYSSRPLEEDIGNKNLNALSTYRQFMSYNEVFQYLDTLHEISSTAKGKAELTTYLPLMLNLFKTMLIEYDSSGMNIVITNILNNVVAKNSLKGVEMSTKMLTAAVAATEPVAMKNVVIQIPTKNNLKKNKNSRTLASTPAKCRQAAKRNVNREWDQQNQRSNKCALAFTRSRKCNKDLNPSVIVVPIDRKENNIDE